MFAQRYLHFVDRRRVLYIAHTATGAGAGVSISLVFKSGRPAIARPHSDNKRPPAGVAKGQL